MIIKSITRRIELLPRRMARNAVRKLGTPPAWTGYRWLEPQSVRSIPEAPTKSAEGGSYEILHHAGRARNPLPKNITTIDDLPGDRGWWGYSFRDVPTRLSGQTLEATIHDCRVVPFIDPDNHQFYVCILTQDDRVLDLREMAFRPHRHPAIIRGMRPRTIERATWVLERVYHNHSHWLTAHLPKILLAKERGRLSETILPGALTNSTIDGSLRMLRVVRSDEFRLDPIEPLRVKELTVIETDRFRPELLRSVRDAMSDWISGSRSRRLYISRDRATRRRLLNEGSIWPMLQKAGFERVFMEDLAFEDQVRLMGEAEAVVAPHGAGLTNVMFCPPGTAVVEIADLSFPNPNFYAVASAMGHDYWVLAAETRGVGHPLGRDMWIDPAMVQRALDEL